MSDNKFIEQKNENIFRIFMIEGANFDGKWDIPIIPDNVYTLPDLLVPYNKIKSSKVTKNAFVHFFIYDYLFDGPNGIWEGPRSNLKKNKGFSISSFYKYKGIIGPDFSMGFGLPLATVLDNCRRRRYIEHWFYKLGFQVVPFVRWTDERSFEFCFLGLTKNSIIAISTYGSMQNKFLNKYFLIGLKELIVQVEPRLIIIYGSLSKEVIDILSNNNIKYIVYNNTTFNYKGDSNGRIKTK